MSPPSRSLWRVEIYLYSLKRVCAEVYSVRVAAVQRLFGAFAAGKKTLLAPSDLSVHVG